jgi:uncharacterized protein DUF4395
MAAITATTKDRIEAQGFVGLDDHTLAQINYWLRLAPALCMAWSAVGTYRESPGILWALVPFAVLGAVLPGHPFDVLYTYGFRRLTRGSALPRYPLPRRLACALGAALLSGAAISFQTDHATVGAVLGWSLAAAAFVNVTTGFCIPSFLYGLMFGRPSACSVASPAR